MNAARRKLVLLLILLVLMLVLAAPALADGPPGSACNGLKWAAEKAYDPHLSNLDVPQQVVDIILECQK